VSDAYDELTDEHRAAAGMLERFTSSGDEALALEVADLLVSHATAEQRIVVPELRRFVDGGDDIADEAAPELDALVTAATAVLGADQGDLASLVERLRAECVTHIERMEQAVFPAMREAGVDAAALARALDAPD